MTRDTIEVRGIWLRGDGQYLVVDVEQLCDRCRCAPRRRRPLRRYFGRWLDLTCGKLMEAMR